MLANFKVWNAAAGLLLLVTPAAIQAQPLRVQLPVPWVCQLLPGSTWLTTKTCGPSCAEMIDAYFTHRTATQAHIIASDQWLANHFHDPSYSTPNGNVTQFVGRDELGTLIEQRYGLICAPSSGASFAAIEQELAEGRPVIAGVTTLGGTLVGPGVKGSVAHWVVVTGYDALKGIVYLNDPGRSAGNQVTYSIAAFNITWSTSGHQMAAVFP